MLYDKKDDFLGGESASEKIKFFREKALLFPELRHNIVYDLGEIIQDPINRGMEEENK